MANDSADPIWWSKCPQIEGILSDITGVLYESGKGGGKAIPGSVQAVERLRAAGIPFKFCTNETQCTTVQIANKLNQLGFSIQPNEIIAPAPAACSLFKQRNLRPYLLVHPGVLSEFSDIDTTNPNCLVVGDAGDEFSYANMNKAFQLLISLEKPLLFSLGCGRYYKEDDTLRMDVGAFVSAFEFAADVKAEIVGKPSPAFFEQSLRAMNVTADKAIMIGDDIVSDVGGAQACGIMGIMVRTGKYRPSDEPHATVKPDAYVNNLSQFVDMFLEHRI